jgi:hypothetical protein
MDSKTNREYCESTCQIEETCPADISDVIGGDDPFLIFTTPSTESAFLAGGIGSLAPSGGLGSALSGIVQIAVVNVPDAKPQPKPKPQMMPPIPVPQLGRPGRP